MWSGKQRTRGSTQVEVCHIDSGITSLRDLHLSTQITVLNLHSNRIERIESLEGCPNLQHLDLSSNHISMIDGLRTLSNLRILNLACNQISQVEGLNGLKSLVQLNLAYNRISDVSGLQVIQGRAYSLSQLELHGNCLHSLPHLARSVKGCIHLRSLTLTQTGAGNPVCEARDYRSTVFTTLPGLMSLDGLDRRGNPSITDDVTLDIPGLEQYMDYLVSSESSDANPLAVVTPQIDAALDAWRQRGVTSPECTTSAPTQSELDTSHQESPRDKVKPRVPDHELRLMKLEDQLSKLLTSQVSTEKSKRRAGQLSSGTSTVRHTAKRDIDVTDASDDSSSTEEQGPPQRGKISTVTARRIANSTKRASTKATAHTNTVVGSPKGAKQRSMSPSRHRQQASARMDQAMRADVEDTYLHLMKELEVERERRWKAEQAAKKLAEHIQQLRTQAKEEQDLQSVAVEATSRLKQALTNEREVRLRTKAELELAQEEVEGLKNECAERRRSQDELQKALHVFESNASKAERETLQQQAHQGKRLQEAELQVAALTREVELMKASNKSAKQQIHQLQELLANREQEHREELSKRFTIDSPKMQDALRREISQVEKTHALELSQHKEKVEILSKQYTDLEDEFREALLSEEARFKHVQGAYERLSEEHGSNKRALILAQEKDSKSSSMITDLTSMVKEQKGRISELLKAKQEQTSDMKERLLLQESHLEEARRRMVQFELLKKERVKLESQLQAQESVIEGLKAERRLWGEELAQQGSSLAQDRGRLEAKIESQSSDITSLKKQLERECDAVRIKAKMIEDQTETIRKLKEALLERDEEVKKCREQTLQVQKDLEDQLTTETAVNQDLQEQFDRLTERKKELKTRITELEEHLDESNQSHSKLNRKWKEKSTLIGQLEQQVTQMRDAWSAKERKIIEERDRALNAASVAVEKLKKIDDSFRKQLDNMHDSHQKELHQLHHQKEHEVDQANKRVFEVEDEMRQLLREAEQNKKQMEDRVKRLNQAFSDLQHDL